MYQKSSTGKIGEKMGGGGLIGQTLPCGANKNVADMLIKNWDVLKRSSIVRSARSNLKNYYIKQARLLITTKLCTLDYAFSMGHSTIL